MTEIATATVVPSNYSFADDRINDKRNDRINDKRNDRINDTRNDVRMTQETNREMLLQRGRAEQ